MLKIKFKEEKITKEEAVNMLDIYYSSNDENYKFWFKEITPFRDFKDNGNFIITNPLFNWNIFDYKWTLFKVLELEKDEIHLKWYINNKLAIFFSIYNDRLISKKHIYINKMIVLDHWKWIWRLSIKKLCDYYSIYNIIIKPSWTWLPFWNKMILEYKSVINIIIKELWYK